MEGELLFAAAAAAAWKMKRERERRENFYLLNLPRLSLILSPYSYSYYTPVSIIHT
jgi:hypothetical protein